MSPQRWRDFQRGPRSVQGLPSPLFPAEPTLQATRLSRRRSVRLQIAAGFVLKGDPAQHLIEAI